MDIGWQLCAPRANDPPVVFFIKSLLAPLAAVLSLLSSLMLYGEQLNGTYFLLAVLSFLTAGDLLDVAPSGSGMGAMQAWVGRLALPLRWVVMVAFLWMLLQLAGVGGQLHARVLAAWALLMPVLLWGGQLAAGVLLRKFGANGIRPRQAVIVGVTDVGLRLEQELVTAPLLNTSVLGFFEDRSARLPWHDPRKVLGRSSDLPSYVKSSGIDLVYVTLPMTRHPRILGLLEDLRDCTASIYFVPDLLPFNLVQARFDLVNRIPVVAVRESPFFGVRGFVKRLTDLVVASAIVVLVSPVLLAVAIGVRLGSPGPVFFKQRRYGLDGKEITIYKFRSMTVVEDGDKSYTQVTRNDARVTAFGSFIRKCSLDELPQFFNVIAGTMSIVGPRPHAIAVNEQYRRLISGYMIRHKVKPGITGWAQINGYRGGDDIESMRKRVEFDLEYLCHWSLGLDLMIMLRTARLVWADRSAF